MILVDKELRKRLNDPNKLIEGYLSDSQINCVSCDLTVDKVVNETMTDGAFELYPGNVVFVKTNEKINMPDDLLGIVTEKNSIMRLGLKVDAPRYHPGHSTNIFLRVQNISDKVITISKDEEIAQIMFEKLSDIPEAPYNKQASASFNEEYEYKGFGKYKEKYNKQIKELDDAVSQAKDDINSASHRIYANVLTLMGVIVAIFSLITINYNAASQQTVDLKFLIAMNLSLSFCIVLLMGLIFLFLNSRKHKSLWIVFLLSFVLLGIAVVVFSIYILNP